MVERGNRWINRRTHLSFVLSISNETTAFYIFRFFASACGTGGGTLAAGIWVGGDEMGRNGFVPAVEIFCDGYAFKQSASALESVY